jgi:hypothetical protein
MKRSSIFGRVISAGGIFLVLSIGLVLSAPACGHDASPAEAAADDGWRHTSQGWERIDQWQTTHVSPFASYWHESEADESLTDPSTSMRLGQLHPALLALIQMTLAGGALALFPATVRFDGKY